MLDTFTRETEVNERKMLHCADCKRKTIHNLEARCTGRWTSGDGMVDGGSEFSTYRCGACDDVCFETAHWDSEDFDHDEEGNVFPNVVHRQYPAPVSAHFTFNTTSTPNKLDDLLEEMLYALAGSKMTLATVGLRLVVEFIVNDRECAGTTLVQKINDLHAQGLIDDDQKDLLHRIRIRGNAGAHKAQSMKPKELVAGMAIVEGLLEKLYNGPARHAETVKRAKELLNTDNEQPKPALPFPMPASTS